MKKIIDYKLQGKKNRKNGSYFERLVRTDLENKGYIVVKNTNNIDLLNNKIIIAKHKFNPFNKIMAIGTGFPDFICFRNRKCFCSPNGETYEVLAVECKVNGYLSLEEREKVNWLKLNKIYNCILIAKKSKTNIEYKEI